MIVENTKMRNLMIRLGMITPSNSKKLDEMHSPSPQRWFEEGETVITVERVFNSTTGRKENCKTVWVVPPTLRMHWRDKMAKPIAFETFEAE